MVTLVTSQHLWRVITNLEMRVYLPVYQLTDWMAHVPVEGKFLLSKTCSSYLARFVVLAKNFKTYVPFPCSSIIESDLSEIVRDISAFAHIPSQQLYIFPGGNNKNKFLFRHHLLTTCSDSSPVRQRVRCCQSKWSHTPTLCFPTLKSTTNTT